MTPTPAIDEAIAPRRIGLGITELEPGGAERNLVRLALGLDRAQFSPVVYALAGLPVRRQLVEQLERAKVPVRYLEAKSIWGFRAAARSWAGQLQSDGVQLLQTFLFHANGLGASAARQAGLPHVAGLRVCEPRWWRRRCERWLLGPKAHAACVSRAVANLALADGYAAENVHVIPNGVELPPPRSTDEAERSANGRLLLAVGRLERQKGFDWLLNLAPQLLAELPHHTLAIAGDGPERGRLERLAERSDVSQRILFLGWQGDLASLWSRSDLFLLPSRWEGFSNALLEAMAAGLPVTVAHGLGDADGLDLAATGQQPASPDPEAFVATAVKLVQQAAWARTVGEANRRRVQEKFTVAGMVRAHEQLWAKVLAVGQALD